MAAIGVNWADIWAPVWGDVWAQEQSPGVIVPDVVGQSQASGTTELQGEGFTVRVVGVYSAIVAAGDIVSQDPAAGIEAPSGSQVTINVSLGEAPEAQYGSIAKMMLILRKRKRIKQRQEVKDGR